MCVLSCHTYTQNGMKGMSNDSVVDMMHKCTSFNFQNQYHHIAYEWDETRWLPSVKHNILSASQGNAHTFKTWHETYAREHALTAVLTLIPCITHHHKRYISRRVTKSYKASIINAIS